MLKIKKFKIFREFGILVALFAMVIIFTALNPIYISFNNIIDIIQQSAINGLIAIGITFAILTAGIDLSVGSTLAIVIVVVGKFLTSGLNPIIAIFIGILIGFLLGVFNGLLITKLKIQPFVATLGTMSVYRGIAYVITGGWPVLNMPRDFRNLVSGRVFNIIPIPIFILIGFAIITHILLNHTRFGTYVYSIGGNEEATRLSGVNVEKNKVLAYGLVGVGAALAALVLLARLGTGEPTAGQGYELDAIAAAAIGGTSLAGGKGSVLGTFLGAILLSALKVGLIVTGVDTFWQFIATGSIIIIAVYLEHVQSQLYKK
ncbi:ABC transporter permease [Halanaerobium kushneri]|uniref:Monosaccharide ABC transporter membrane protein, CUT2 family n=1 Tax=Halanaerobium kushneri TaxID=56779 RepID=A0A1N6SN28_9FIRM|nr:ABC transporter permease [Halanaerobium kushneri]SIQ42525.1 monosaccharide ABC transporter membrane protein, CUT2 family [Halanaerobium kushneri]